MHLWTSPLATSPQWQTDHRRARSAAYVDAVVDPQAAVDLVASCDELPAQFPGRFEAARRPDGWSDHTQLSAALLRDDANAILAALQAAIRAGASRADLGRSMAYAAALRVARFGTANEHA